MRKGLIRRGITALSSAILMTGLGVNVAAGPAAAIPADCAPSYLCLWNDLEATGIVLMASPEPHPAGTCFLNLTDAIVEDQATSLFNRSSRTLVVFAGRDCTAPEGYVVVQPGDYLPDLRVQGINDAISSVGVVS